MATRWDLIVIGGGSGGLACAQRAAEHGARVVLAEPGPIGGTCVNAGCVPKKLMYHAAELAHGIADAADYGFDVALGAHDWGALKARRDAYVRKLHGVYLENLTKRGVTLLTERARIAGPGRVVIGTQEQAAGRIVIASGGHPLVPAIPGAELGITSDGFFALERMPATVAIVGSGYVAAELSGVFAALGAKVTVLMRHDRMLRSFDGMLSRRLMAAMTADGIELVADAVPAAVSGRAGTATVELADGRRPGPFECLIWAVGRTPNAAGLGLEAAGVALGGAGEIVTDLRQDTNVAGIHAIGDVTGRVALTPVAIAAGRRLADRLFGGEADRHLEYRNIPTVIFSHPPIGTVGLSEEEARAQFGDRVAVFQGDFMPLYHGITERRRRAEVKLVATGPDRRVVGLHAIGMGADEMLQGFAVAIRMGATKADFDDTVAIHPTTAEEVVTLRG
ncbi:MAG: glutathione-disulfide reductase [Steroidobacteraceae bacterium]|nr:glutathione-disulfide reductase [Steroidobacteraceae bacterium]